MSESSLDLPATGVPWDPPPVGYLDATGGQPLLPGVRIAIEAAWTQGFAEAGRIHHAGRRAGLLLQAARESVAASLGVQPDEVFFATSVPAALHALIDGTLAATNTPADGTPPIWASAVETRAVLNLVSAHPHRLISVDALGHVDLAALQRSLAPAPALACIQAANIETGTRQPLDAIAAALPGTALLSDLTGLLGRQPPPGGWAMGVSGLRDIGGPPGVTVAVVRRGHRWATPPTTSVGWLDVTGTGAPDVAAAVGAATALELLAPVAEAESARAHALITHLRRRIIDDIADVDVVGDPDDRLPHVVCASVLYVDGEALVSELDRLGFAVASGSACVADGSEPSHVLAAMGALTGGNVRISLPFGIDAAAVDRFADAFADVIRALRQRYL